MLFYEHCSNCGGDGVSISAVKSIEKTTVVVFVINVPIVEEVDLDFILPAVTVSERLLLLFFIRCL